MFVGALFIIVANLEPKHPSTRVNKLHYRYNGTVNSKKKETTGICNKNESEKTPLC